MAAAVAATSSLTLAYSPPSALNDDLLGAATGGGAGLGVFRCTRIFGFAGILGFSFGGSAGGGGLGAVCLLFTTTTGLGVPLRIVDDVVRDLFDVRLVSLAGGMSGALLLLLLLLLL